MNRIRDSESETCISGTVRYSSACGYALRTPNEKGLLAKADTKRELLKLEAQSFAHVLQVTDLPTVASRNSPKRLLAATEELCLAALEVEQPAAARGRNRRRQKESPRRIAAA
jgi:hypothetical protein